jgi:hypothetical protein
MSKTFLLASALLIGGAAFASSAQTAWTAEAESAAAARKACEQDATRQHYAGKQRSRFIRQCLARRSRPQDKDVARPEMQPSDPFAMPQPAPLRRTSRPGAMGGTLPSNAPVAPSTPVIGSSGTSTTGSSATSISGSSGTSIGGMR